MKRILIAAVLVCMAGAAQASSWSVDKSQSTLGFTATQTGKPFTGSFKSFDAAIDFDPANPAAGHAVVTIDIASATTGDKQRDEAIPGSDWFDVKKFPQAKFEATGFKALGGNKYEAIGTLSIRDVKKDVRLPFTLDIAGNTATANGTLPLIRTDYGVGQGDWATGQWVGLDVDVTLHIVAMAK
jgi:polyisoprenoid-binding protein YceI